MKDSEAPKITDVRQNISRIEFKDTQAYEKVFDCRVLQRKRYVTRAYVERKKQNPTFSVFGAGKGNDNLRMNATITMVQRDNVWHPSYEVKCEDEDLGTKLRNRTAAGGQAAEDAEIERLRKEIEDKEKLGAEEEKKGGEAAPQKKKLFDMEAIKKKAEEAMADAANTKVIDPRAIRLQDLPFSMTEEDLRSAIARKFGPIERVIIPIDDRGRNRGFAIIGFTNASSAQKAIENQDVVINSACLTI